MRHRFAASACLALLLPACASQTYLGDGRDRLQVITTTGILRDLVHHVGGDRVDVVSIVPDGADPHSHEPTLRDARDVAYADVAFSNYALLEERDVVRTLDAGLREDAVHVPLAEESVKYAAELIPLVENVSLDTVWLGVRVNGDGADLGASRTSQVLLSATGLEGPGDMYAYLTGTFGDTDVYVDSSDGFDAATGYRDDTMALPTAAHTHLSWAFTEPGVYRLDLRAQLQVDDTARPVDVGEGTLTFAVGVDPSRAGVSDPVVLAEGHADVTADLETGAMQVRYDPEGASRADQEVHPLDDVVVSIPASALSQIPGEPQYRFLGRPGEDLYQIAQAVLGRHVHGEIDPHLWHDAGNTMAYVQLIRDTLIAADPAGARTYRDNTDAYLAELEDVDAYMRAAVAGVPQENRYLVTTHDAFGYLAEAYGLRVAGFVTPNPAVEPSLADRRRLTESLRTLEIPAVFLEPNLAARSSTLVELAEDAGVAVCPIYGDSLDGQVSSYVELMRFNADSLRECLGAAGSPDGGASSTPPIDTSQDDHGHEH